MKVAFCHYGPSVMGGPASWLRRIVPRLRRRGVDPIVVTCMTRSGPCRVGESLRELGLRVREVDGECWPHLAVERMIEVFVEERPRVIIADHVQPAFIAGDWARSRGIPVVMIVRSDDAWYREQTAAFLLTESPLRVSGVVSVSRELDADLDGRIPPNVMRMQCPSSVPLPQTTAHWQGGRFHAVYLGRIEQEQKRARELARSLVETSRTLPGFSAALHGTGSLEAEISAYLTGEPDHRVTLPGPLSEEEIHPHLLDAQAFVLFSAFEGLSSAVQEAMACGLPVIARRTRSGQAGVLVHGETALLLDDDGEFPEAVRRLAGSENLWNRLSTAARQLATEAFDIEKAADRWWAFLNRLEVPKDDGPGPGDPGPGHLGARGFALHLDTRQTLNDYEADFLLSRQDEPHPILVGHLTDPDRDWSVRCEKFFRALAVRVLHPEAIAEVARTLADQEETRVGPASRTLREAYNLASLRKHAREWDRAAAAFETVLLAPDGADMRPGCRFHLGDIAARVGRMAEAETHLLACLAGNPDHRAARGLLRAVRHRCTSGAHTPSVPG